MENEKNIKVFPVDDWLGEDIEIIETDGTQRVGLLEEYNEKGITLYLFDNTVVFVPYEQIKSIMKVD